MREIALKSPEIQKVNEENRELYEALSRYSGENVKNPDDVFDIFGTLEAEVLNLSILTSYAHIDTFIIHSIMQN